VTLAVHGQTIPELQPVVLDPQKCLEDFERVAAREKAFTETFSQHQSFTISYEEMTTPGSEKLQCLLDFMGVSRRELTTTTKKLRNNNLRTAIANFDELGTHFAGSPYSKFFEDA
jgi:hypothetical protein